MTPEQFCYWLQGYFELNQNGRHHGMSPEQVQTIEDHLRLVFDKVTPDRFPVVPRPEPWPSPFPSPVFPWPATPVHPYDPTQPLKIIC